MSQIYGLIEAAPGAFAGISGMMIEEDRTLMMRSLSLMSLTVLLLAACEGDPLSQIPIDAGAVEEHADATAIVHPDAEIPGEPDAAIAPQEDAMIAVYPDAELPGEPDAAEEDASEPDTGVAPVGCGTPASVYATLNPADRQQNIVLTGGDLTAKTTSTNDSVRATIGKRYGRWYFEVRVAANGGAFNAVGVASAAGFLELGVGSADYGCGYSPNGSMECAFGSYRDWNVAPVAAGAIVQVAVDLDHRRIYFGRDGTWLPGHDPALMTGGLDIGYDPDCAAIFPALTLSENDQFIANFGASPFAHPVPAGYEAGWFEDATCPADHCGSSPVEPASCALVTDPALITAAYPHSAPNNGQCSGGYTYSNYTNTQLTACYPEEMHVIGVYEGTTNRVTVNIMPTPLPVILVLNAYSSIVWTLNVDPAAQLSRVIVHGYEPQLVNGLPATATLVDTGQFGPIDTYTYGWEVSANAGGGSFYQLASDVRSYTQQMELSFQGCYQGANFTVPY